MAGTQTTIVPTNLPSFPWVPGDKLDAIPLNNQFIALQNLINNLQAQVNLIGGRDGGNIPVGITVDWGGRSIVTPGIYTITGSAPYDFYVSEIDTNIGISGGSFSVTLLNNGTPVAGLQNIFVDQTFNKAFFATTNDPTTLVARGNLLQLQVSGITGQPSEAFITINGTTAPTIAPQIGIAPGSASGSSAAISTGYGLPLGSGLGEIAGRSTTQAIALAAANMTGIITASSDASAHGVRVTLGNITGVANGTSDASAVGEAGSSNSLHVFVFDDPNYGVLDTNPLG